MGFSAAAWLDVKTSVRGATCSWVAGWIRDRFMLQWGVGRGALIRNSGALFSASIITVLAACGSTDARISATADSVDHAVDAASSLDAAGGSAQDVLSIFQSLPTRACTSTVTGEPEICDPTRWPLQQVFNPRREAMRVFLTAKLDDRGGVAVVSLSNDLLARLLETPEVNEISLQEIGVDSSESLGSSLLTARLLIFRQLSDDDELRNALLEHCESEQNRSAESLCFFAAAAFRGDFADARRIAGSIETEEYNSGQLESFAQMRFHFVRLCLRRNDLLAARQALLEWSADIGAFPAIYVDAWNELKARDRESLVAIRGRLYEAALSGRTLDAASAALVLVQVKSDVVERRDVRRVIEYWRSELEDEPDCIEFGPHRYSAESAEARACLRPYAEEIERLADQL